MIMATIQTGLFTLCAVTVSLHSYDQLAPFLVRDTNMSVHFIEISDLPRDILAADTHGYIALGSHWL